MKAKFIEDMVQDVPINSLKSILKKNLHHFYRCLCGGLKVGMSKLLVCNKVGSNVW